jgi:hypothetical protein
VIKLTIKESIKTIDGGKILILDYVGDVVNLLINKPKPYRIVYSKYDDVYVIGDAKDYVHIELTDIAMNKGYLYKTKEFMENHHIDINELDSMYTDNLIFLTANDLDKFGGYTDPYATAEFGYEYPITTGSIFTKSQFGRNYFKRNCADLYNKLQKYAIDEPYVLYDNGWNI